MKGQVQHVNIIHSLVGGRQETRVPEESGPAVPPDVVLLWHQGDPGHDLAQCPQLW